MCHLCSTVCNCGSILAKMNLVRSINAVQWDYKCEYIQSFMVELKEEKLSSPKHTIENNDMINLINLIF